MPNKIPKTAPYIRSSYGVAYRQLNVFRNFKVPSNLTYYLGGKTTPGSGTGSSATSSLNNGLVSYWKLDNLLGTDSVGVNTLTMSGNALNAPGRISNGIAGNVSGASVGSRASTTGLNFTAATSFTVAAWVSIPTQPVTAIVRKRTNIAGYHLDTFPATTPRFITGNGAGLDVLASANALALTWNRVIGYFNAATSKIGIIVNSNAAEELAISAFAPPVDADALSVPNIQLPDAVVDEVSVWSRLLTAAEVIEHFNGGNGKTYPYT